MGHPALKASETSDIIQARIEGLQGPKQVTVINRLRKLGVPEAIIWPATRAKQGDQGPEVELITWFQNTNNVTDVAAVRVLNGQSTLREEWDRYKKS